MRLFIVSKPSMLTVKLVKALFKSADVPAPRATHHPGPALNDVTVKLSIHFHGPSQCFTVLKDNIADHPGPCCVSSCLDHRMAQGERPMLPVIRTASLAAGCCSLLSVLRKFRVARTKNGACM